MPRASITCSAIMAVSQYVKCSQDELVAPWPNGSIARRFMSEVTFSLSNWSRYSETVVHIELISTHVGLEGSYMSLDREYPAVIPPRCGTRIVLEAAMDWKSWAEIREGE
jgi:hypothetical protein